MKTVVNSTTPTKFAINFKSRSAFLPNQFTPAEKRILDYLNSLPDGDVIDRHELCAQAKVSIGHLSHFNPSFFADHRHKVKNAFWYGSNKTITELKKQYP